MQITIKQNEETKELLLNLISDDKEASKAASEELSKLITGVAEDFLSNFACPDNFYRHEKIGEFDPRVIPKEWVKNSEAKLRGSAAARHGDLAFTNDFDGNTFPVSMFSITVRVTKQKEYFNEDRQGLKAFDALFRKAYEEIKFKINTQAIQPILSCLADNSQILVSEKRGELSKGDVTKLLEGSVDTSKLTILTSPEIVDLNGSSFVGQSLPEGSDQLYIVSKSEFGTGQRFNQIFGALAGEKTFINSDGNQISFNPEKMDLILAVENEDNNLFKISISEEGNIFDVQIYVEDDNVCLEITTECSYTAFDPIGAVAMIV